MQFSRKERKKIIQVVSALVAILIGGIGYVTLFASNDAPEGTFIVDRVVDGDTIVVRDNGVLSLSTHTIRLIGVNTPETVDPRKTVECFGTEASAYLKSALPEGTPVYLDADPSKPDTDSFDRLLRYVIRANDMKIINKAIIEEGYGHEADFNEPYLYKDEFVAAQKDAQTAKRGLWADDACVKTV